MKTALILLCFLVSGCVGMNVYRDSEGRIKRIKRTGFLPGKTKIEDCEIDTKISLFDFNILKSK
jgi:hypothetical protein